MNRVIQFLNESSDSGLMKQSVHLAKGYSLTKNGRYDDDMLIGKATGNIKSTLLLPGIIGMIRRNNNLERINSDAYKEIKELILKDEKCVELLKSIKRELVGRRRSSILKELKSKLFAEIQRVQDEYITFTDSNEEINECININNLLEEVPLINPTVQFLNELKIIIPPGWEETQAYLNKLGLKKGESSDENYDKLNSIKLKIYKEYYNKKRTDVLKKLIKKI